MTPIISTQQTRHERFDVAEINKISIRDFLEQQGYMSKNSNAAYGMYLASWREDNNPSLMVDYNKNRWYDFGLGKGGTIIDLFKEIYKISFVEACKKLCNDNIPKMEIQTKFTERKLPKISVLQEKPVSHFVLKNYLMQRGIDVTMAMMYIKEVEFTVEGKDKNYFGLGFKNESGGFEIRNEFFKGCTSKDVTIIDKSLPNCNVFEGFFDFLSYEGLSRRFPMQYPAANALVLNSTINIEKSKVEEFLKKQKAVNCYLDNDENGKQTFVRLAEKISPYCQIMDCSSLYMGFKDFNEFSVNTYKISQISQGRKL